MKKIIFATIFAISSLVVSAQARDWNIPEGSYSCHVVSINDANWNVVKYFSKEEREKTTAGFVLDDTKIVDAAGLVFIDQGKNKEGTDNLIGKDNINAIYIPKKASSGDHYNIGLGRVSDGKVIRMMMHCTKD